MGEENQRLTNDENHLCLRSFKTHWAEAQIDGPMQAVARYDDLAKLLITIGGFVLALIAGGYSTMLKGSGDAMNKSHAMSTTVMILGSMLAFFLSAAMVCVWQPKPRALQIMDAKDDEALTREIKEWCGNIGRVILWKKICLGFTTFFFVLSFLVMMWLLVKSS
jgi:hypothetical protein